MTDVASHYFRDVYFQCFRCWPVGIQHHLSVCPSSYSIGDENSGHMMQQTKHFMIRILPYVTSPLGSTQKLTILTSSMLEKLRTKMLTWTNVAESGTKETIVWETLPNHITAHAITLRCRCWESLLASTEAILSDTREMKCSERRAKRGFYLITTFCCSQVPFPKKSVSYR